MQAEAISRTPMSRAYVYSMVMQMAAGGWEIAGMARQTATTSTSRAQHRECVRAVGLSTHLRRLAVGRIRAHGKWIALGHA